MKVEWTKTAENDFEHVIDYIYERNPQAGIDIYKKIKEKVLNPAENPKSGRVIPELQTFNIVKYREIISSPWQILYQIQQETIYIMAVIDGRRNVEDILLEKLLRNNI